MGYPDYDEGGRLWDPESQWGIAASGRNGSLLPIYGDDWIYRDFGATFFHGRIILGNMRVKPETMESYWGLCL